MLDFTITGPDNDTFVWLSWKDAAGEHMLNLGTGEAVIEKLSQFLASIEEREEI